MSIAHALAARGLTQRQIAEQLGVTHKTVRNWLGNFREAPELVNDTPALPDAATLDAIAKAIKDGAKGEVRAVAQEPTHAHDGRRRALAGYLPSTSRRLA